MSHFDLGVPAGESFSTQAFLRNDSDNIVREERPDRQPSPTLT